MSINPLAALAQTQDQIRQRLLELTPTVSADLIREGGWLIKLHKGSLREFLAVVPEQFDDVYFDACGPLFGGKPKTSIVLRELFLHQRIAPLSVLITNFAAKPRDTEDDWIKRFHSWYAPRYFQPVWGNIDGASSLERIGDPKQFFANLKENLARIAQGAFAK